MKFKFILVELLLFCFINKELHAQLKIGDNATTINSASLLELETTNKGLVFPRISLTNINSSSPLPPGLLTGTVVYNTNASVTGGNGVGLYVWNGLGWISITPNVTSTAWSLTGNAGTNYTNNFIGTTDNTGFRLRTNNIQRILVDSLGSVAIGSTNFNASLRERLLVDYGTTTSNNIATFKGNIDDYFQVGVQNTSSGTSASSDFVATSSDGTDSTYYIDMGINGANYAPGVENWGGPHDGYLYTYGRHLLMGTQGTNSDVIFMLGGGKIKTNAAFRINGSDLSLVVGRGEATNTPVGNILRGPNASGTNIAGGNITIQGGSGTGTAGGGILYLNGGTSVSGTAGSIIAATAATERLRIDASGNVGIANASPAEKLDVTGNVRFSGALMPNNLAGTSGYLLTSSGAGTAPSWSNPATISATYNWLLGGNTLSSQQNFGTLNNYAIPFIVNGTEKMRLSTSGYLGLGTNAPAGGFQMVTSADELADDYLFDDYGTTTPGFFARKARGTSASPSNLQNGDLIGQFMFSPRINGTTDYLYHSGFQFYYKGSGTTDLEDFRLYTSAAERLRLDENGNLGIATTNPLYRLSVFAASNPLYLSGVQATSTLNSDSLLTINAGVVKKVSYASLIGVNEWSLTGNTGTTAGTNFIGTTDNIDFVTKTNNTERMRVTGAGRVGIGTNSPASDLTIYQSSGSGNSKGFTFTGNSIGATNTGTGFLMSLGYNITGNKQLWLGDGDYAGNASGSFARLNVTGTSFPVLDAVSGNNVLRRYLALGVSGDANSGVIFGSDNTGTNPGSQVWDNGNMSIGAGYKSYAAPSNGLLVQGNVGIGTASPTNTLSVLAASNPLYLSGVQATSSFSTDSILTISAGVVKKAPYTSLPSANGWQTTGNSGTSTASNFLGTTDGNGLVFKVNNAQAGYLGISGSSYSTSLGVGASGTSTGFQATAIGAGAQATANTSVALGYSSTASVQNAIAIGNISQATTGNDAIAMGYNARALSYQSLAIGSGSTASTSNQTIAIGTNASATGYQGISIGYGTVTSTNNSALAIGVSATATGYQSTALGNSASATGQNTTAIGNGATTSQTNALVLGNSTTNVGIGTSTPNTSAKLDVAGSFKLGASGTLLANIIKTTITVTPTVAIGTTTTVTATVTGATTTSNVLINPRANLANGVVIAYYYISAANTLTIGFNSGTTTGSLGSLTFDVTLIQ